ncbi:MAG: hypothetical protein QFE16_00750 [Pseudomonadota bacterium]|nr:hypothetical protein [Pseudomonadota bacterium]
MSVTKITAVGRVELPNAAAHPSDGNPAPSVESRNQKSVSQGSDEPAARRFPWLSWQTHQLEAATKQPSPYGRVPVLGQALDLEA